MPQACDRAVFAHAKAGFLTSLSQPRSSQSSQHPHKRRKIKVRESAVCEKSMKIGYMMTHEKKTCLMPTAPPPLDCEIRVNRGP